MKQETRVDKFIGEAGEVDNPNKEYDKFDTTISIVKGTYRSAGEREKMISLPPLLQKLDNVWLLGACFGFEEATSPALMVAGCHQNEDLERVVNHDKSATLFPRPTIDGTKVKAAQKHTTIKPT